MYDLKDDESFLKCVESFYSDFTGYNEKSSKFARDNFGWNSVINDLLSKLESILITYLIGIVFYHLEHLHERSGLD